MDVPVFGEIGLIAARRGADGKPAPIPDGRVVLPRGAAQGMHVLSVARTPGGTLALSGPMVPHAPFPPGAERSGGPRLKITDGSDRHRLSLPRSIATRRCSPSTARRPASSASAATASRLRAAQDLVAGIEDGSTLAALPDLLAGHRLAGAGADRDAICDALLAHGANPLLVAAFRARKSSQQASAA